MKRTVMASLSFVFLVIAGFVSLMFSGGFGGKLGKTISSVEQLASVFSLMSGEETENCDSATVHLNYKIKSFSKEGSFEASFNSTVCITEDVYYMKAIIDPGFDSEDDNNAVRELITIEMYQFIKDKELYIKDDNNEWEFVDFSEYSDLTEDFGTEEINEQFKHLKAPDFDIVNNVATLKDEAFVDFFKSVMDIMEDEEFDADILSGHIKIFLFDPNEPKLSMKVSMTVDSITAETEAYYTFTRINSTTVQIPAAIVDLRRAA